MKKTFKILGLTILIPVILLLVAAIIVPSFFKSDIKKALDATLQDYITANVNYDEESLSLSIFRDFPNMQLSIGELSIINQAPFAGDTLISIQELNISLDIKSLLTNNMKINGVYLVEPRVFAQIDKNGFANWDILIPDTTSTDTSSSEIVTQIDHWEVKNGHIEYRDQTSSTLAVIQHLNHSGKGVFGSKINLSAESEAEKIYVSLDNIAYLNDIKLEANNEIEIDGDTYTLGKNNIRLNDLNLFIEGFTTLNEESIDMDLKLNAENNTFKSLVSLIPTVFLEGYEKVEANGDFDLQGMLKGTYTDTQFPLFNFTLNVKDGDLKLPELSKKVSNINFNLELDNQDGIVENTSLDLKNLNLQLANNYIKGRLYAKGGQTYYIDTDLKIDLNLGEIKDFYPLEGNVIQGKLNLNTVAKGIVDLEKNTFPVANGYVNLTDGYVKTPDLNAPLKDINFASTYTSNGTTQDSEVNIKNIKFILDENIFGGEVAVQDFDELNYNIDLNGKIDLEKLFKIFPLEGTTLTGIIDVQSLKSKGNLKAIETENYQLLETSGKAKITNLSYKDDEYLPNGLRITSSNLSFTPEKILLEDYNGFIGNSDVKIEGYVNNYMGYLFGNTDTILGGKMTMNSNQFDVNPFLIEDSTLTETTPTGEESVALIPTDIHFLMNTTMNELIYDDLKLTDFEGILEVVNGSVQMKGVEFRTLGAKFITSGFYDTKDPKHPKYKFNLNILDMPIKEAYTYFSMVKQLAPIAEKIDGFFNTKLEMSGELLSDYMPDMNSLTLSGDLDIIEAIVKSTDVKLLNGIAEKSKLKNISQYKIENERLNVEVKNGKLWVNEFIMNGNDSYLSTQLNIGLADKSINHIVKLDAPSSSLQSNLSSFGLDPDKIGDRINLDFNITGTRDQPKIKLNNVVSGGVKGKVQDKVEEKKEEVKEKVKEDIDKAKQEAEEKAKAEADRLKKEAEEKAKVEAEKAKEKAKEKAADLLKDKGISVPWDKNK